MLNDKPQQSQDLRPYSWFMALLIILHHIADPDGKENETSGQPFATKISLATAWSQRSINLNQSCHLCIRLDRGWYESPGLLQKQTNKQTNKKNKKNCPGKFEAFLFFILFYVPISVLDPDVGKDGRQKEKGLAEDEMVRWHHWLNAREFEQTLGNKWRTEEPGVLKSMGSQRAGHDLATEQQLY